MNKLFSKVSEKYASFIGLGLKLKLIIIVGFITSTAGIGVGASHLINRYNKPPVQAPVQAQTEQTSTSANAEKKTTQEEQKPTEVKPPTVATSKPAPKPQPAAVAPAPAGPSLDAVLADINSSLSPYGVSATFDPTQNQYTYSTWARLTEADASNLQSFAPYLKQEFSKYPKDLVANSGLKKIGLIKNLVVSGGARTAVPVPYTTSMIYDVNALLSAGSVYSRLVISHEYMHYLDYVMNGTYTFSDTDWSTTCNPSGFTYGGSGASAYNDPNYTETFHPQDRFITKYSMYAEEEDRAEMFGWLIYSPSSVKNLADSGLNCKINRLTQMIHQLSPGMSF